MKISRIVDEIEPSLTRKLFNMAQNYDDVIDLTLGDPDLNAPDTIKKAACNAINQNKTHYSSNAGLLELRSKISQRINNSYNIPKTDYENIIVTVGGMEALYLSLLCILDKDDEVLVFAPYYVNYLQMIKMCGAKPVIINAYNDDGFNIKKETLNSYITSKTVAIIVNSPNNPTGDVICEDMLKTIADVAEENNLYVISDEVYKTLVYDKTDFKSISEYLSNKESFVLIDSMSKEYSMTGWRIGYVCSNKSLISAMTKMQENIVACAALPSQYAMIEAYENNIKTDYIVDEFKKRRDFIFEKINNIDKLKCLKPKGTFYAFVNIENTGLDSITFAYKLLEEKHIAVVPGIAYGEKYNNYIRIAFTKEIDTLNQAIEKISDFVDSL